MVAVRGRRQVGKSRLAEVFVERARVPHLFFQASTLSSAGELGLFAEQLAESTLPAADLARDGFTSWTAALTSLAQTASADTPSILVLDEFPYLAVSEPAIEGILQQVWDRHLERRPVLVVLIGSDLAMMEALSAHGRPLYQRSRELLVPPFNPAEIAALLHLGAAEALDAYLVVGGFPRLARSWGRGQTLTSFLREALSDPMSPLVVTGERLLAAELPRDVAARGVLRAIGSGEASFTTIRNTAGVNASVLSRSMDTLVNAKRIVAVDHPVSVPPRRRDPRYRVADPYLRFWLRFVQPSVELAARGRGDLAVRRIRTGWPAYRGRAIEPLVREAITRLCPREDLGGAEEVGGYWTRTNSVEVDLVGTSPAPASVRLVGSIKWRERDVFGDRDVAELDQLAQQVPGVGPATVTVGVSRAGFSTRRLSASLGPVDVLNAWRPAGR